MSNSVKLMPGSRSRAALAVSAAAFALGGLTASPASATVSPTTIADLQTDLATCTGTDQAPYVVILPQALSDGTAELSINCTATIDLDGFALSVRNVTINSGQTLRVTDTSVGATGDLQADASQQAGLPGIRTTNADLFVDSGTVLASGGSSAAAIGGLQNNSGGFVSITGGSVVALGGSNGAGIGGGNLAGGGTVQVSGGKVNAIGGSNAAGVGGGAKGSGGDATVSGGTLIASGGYNGVGSGQPNTGLRAGFGTLVVSGTGILRLTSGNEVVPNFNSGGAEITVSDHGLITGSDINDTPLPVVTYATFVGDGTDTGQIDNQGTILMPTTNLLSGGVTVSHRWYDVSYDTAGSTPATVDPVTVFADSIDAGATGTFPADPTRPGLAFTGWVGIRPDHSQHVVDKDGDLSQFGDATTTAVPVVLHATFQAAPSITGKAAVGQKLSAKLPVTGPKDATPAYVWSRVLVSGGTTTYQPIPGATASTYRLTAADLGKRLAVRIAVVRPSRRTVVVTSPSTAKVAIGHFKAPSAPKVKLPATAHPRVGKEVTVVVHRVAAVKGLKQRIQWYAGKTRVGTHTAKLLITSAMVGKKLTVRVTYSAPGYAPLTVASAPTRTVQS